MRTASGTYRRIRNLDLPRKHENTKKISWASCVRAFLADQQSVLMARGGKASLRAIAIAAALAGTLSAQSQQPRDEEFARRQFDSGLTFLQNKRFAEALKDFQAVVDSFPKSSVADDALLQIATYQLETAHDLAASQTVVDRLLKEYPDSDAAPMGHVLTGRLTIARSREPKDVDVALASFERVPRLFPGADAVPAAGFYAGDTLRTVRRLDDAFGRFNLVSIEYPSTIWAARAAIASAPLLVQSDRAVRAVEALQRVRELFPGSREAAQALNYNTIIYRLYIRAPAQPPYAFAKAIGNEQTKYKDVVGVRADESGNIFLGHKQGVTVFDPKATVLRTFTAEEPSAVFIDERGLAAAARKDVLVGENGQSAAIAIPPTAKDKARPVEEIPSIVVRSDGDRLIADRKGKNVIRISSSGKYIGAFAAVNTDHLAINALDDVAMVDRDQKGVAIVDRDGKPLTRIPARGAGYEFDNPIDLAFDPLGHLYVLDRGKSSIFVFGPKNRLVATITIPEKDPGSLQKAQAFSIDPAGRLYVFDDRSQHLQVYQ